MKNKTRFLGQWILLMGLMASVPGCELLGMVAYMAVGDQQTKTVPAQYRGLENQRFAVLVGADEYTYQQAPQAPPAISQALTQQLVQQIPSAKPADPRQVWKFQQANPYWMTQSYRRLLKRLDVDRLIIVDLVQYRTHEAGNQHVWRGVAVANVSVAEASAATADDLAFSTTVKTVYPQHTSVGLLATEGASFRMALLEQFVNRVAGLFYDHTVVKK